MVGASVPVCCLAVKGYQLREPANKTSNSHVDGHQGEPAF
jgi:hypothetical protein